MAMTTETQATAINETSPALMFDFGDEVKDETGCHGVVYSINEYESGTVQYGIVPSFGMDSDNFGKAIIFDWQDLTLVNKTEKLRPRTPRPPLGFGTEVKDKRTDFQGTIVSIHAFKNGCWKYGVQPRGLTRDGKRVHPELVDQNCVDIIKLAAPVEPPKVGGPERMPV